VTRCSEVEARAAGVSRHGWAARDGPGGVGAGKVGGVGWWRGEVWMVLVPGRVPASCCSASRSGSFCSSSLKAGFCSASESPLYPSPSPPPDSSPLPLFLRRLNELVRLTGFFLDSSDVGSLVLPGGSGHVTHIMEPLCTALTASTHGSSTAATPWSVPMA
jgi:hypothetical protein